MDLNQIMNIWESADTISEGYFKNLLAQIELKLKQKYVLVPSYEGILSALMDLAERNLKEKMASEPLPSVRAVGSNILI